MKTVNTFKRILGSKTGSTSLVFICSTILVVLLSALVTDLGYVAITQFNLSRNVDEITRLGAQNLSKSVEASEGIIREYAIKEIKDINKLDINIADNNKEITVRAGKKVNYIFFKYLNYKDKQLEASATARLSNISSVKGIRPLAVEKNSIKYDKVLEFHVNSKKNAGNDSVVRIIPLGFGKETLAANLIYGINKKVSIEKNIYALDQSNINIKKSDFQKILDKCDHEPKCTYDRYFNDCSRLMVVPVVEKSVAAGKPMSVIGFTNLLVVFQ